MASFSHAVVLCKGGYVMKAVTCLEHSEKTFSIAEQLEYFREHNLTFMPINENKIPLIKWEPLRKRLPNKKELDYGIVNKANEFKGFGFITGKYNGFIVLDVDVKNGNGFESLKGFELPETFTVTTRSGGKHYYFKRPDMKEVYTGQHILPNVDVRGDLGYVVCPFFEGYMANQLIHEVELAECPKWLIDLLAEFGEKKEVQNKQRKRQLKQTKKHLSGVRTGIKFVEKPDLLQGEYLKQFDADEDYIYRACELLEIPYGKIGQAFNCIFPANEVDEKPSANLFRMNDGKIMYRSWRSRFEDDVQPYYSLAEVYASVMYGEQNHLNAPEHAVWKLRLLVELGYVSPYAIKAKELPKSLKDDKKVQAVYEGFKYLLACKYLYEPNKATAFSYRFGGAWCGLPKNDIMHAFNKLMAFGLIECIGKEGEGQFALNVYRLVD